MSYWSKDVFDKAEEATTTSEYAPLPEGEYCVSLVDCEIKKTKAGTGHYLNCRFDVTRNEHIGRVLWMAINVDNPSPVATGIGIGQLKELAYACGKEAWYEQLKACQTWSDAESHLNTLHNTIVNIELISKVKVHKDDKYGVSNIIKGFKKANMSPSIGASKKKDPFS